jgi:hypothetical protein
MSEGEKIVVRAFLSKFDEENKEAIERMKGAAMK